MHIVFFFFTSYDTEALNKQMIDFKYETAFENTFQETTNSKVITGVQLLYTIGNRYKKNDI